MKASILSQEKYQSGNPIIKPKTLIRSYGTNNKKLNPTQKPAKCRGGESEPRCSGRISSSCLYTICVVGSQFRVKSGKGRYYTNSMTKLHLYLFEMARTYIVYLSKSTNVYVFHKILQRIQ